MSNEKMRGNPTDEETRETILPEELLANSLLLHDEIEGENHAEPKISESAPEHDEKTEPALPADEQVLTLSIDEEKIQTYHQNVKKEITKYLLHRQEYLDYLRSIALKKKGKSDSFNRLQMRSEHPSSLLDKGVMSAQSACCEALRAEPKAGFRSRLSRTLRARDNISNSKPKKDPKNTIFKIICEKEIKSNRRTFKEKYSNNLIKAGVVKKEVDRKIKIATKDKKQSKKINAGSAFDVEKMMVTKCLPSRIDPEYLKKTRNRKYNFITKTKKTVEHHNVDSHLDQSKMGMPNLTSNKVTSTFPTKESRGQKLSKKENEVIPFNNLKRNLCIAENKKKTISRSAHVDFFANKKNVLNKHNIHYTSII